MTQDVNETLYQYEGKHLADGHVQRAPWKNAGDTLELVNPSRISCQGKLANRRRAKPLTIHLRER